MGTVLKKCAVMKFCVEFILVHTLVRRSTVENIIKKHFKPDLSLGKEITKLLKNVDAIVGPTVPKLPHKIGLHWSQWKCTPMTSLP